MLCRRRPNVSDVDGPGLCGHDALVHPAPGPVAEADTGQGVLRAVDRRARPLDGDATVVDSGQRVDGGVAVAGECAPAVLESELPPACVAGEEGDVAAAGEESLGVVAHRPGPVLVVSDAHEESVVAEQDVAVVEVVSGAVIDGEPARGEPSKDRLLPVRIGAGVAGALQRDAVGAVGLFVPVGGGAAARPGVGVKVGNGIETRMRAVVPGRRDRTANRARLSCGAPGWTSAT